MEINAQLPREGMLRSRRQLYALVIFATLVFVTMAVFGWMLYRTLAQREIAQLQLDVERKAQQAAVYVEQQAAKAPGRSLAVHMVSSTIRPFLDAVLLQHRGVAALEVLDGDGVRIYSQPNGWVGLPIAAPGLAGALDGGPVRAPIGARGTLVVYLDPREAPRLVAEVRGSVIGQSTSMLAFVLALFGIAAWMVWRNFATSREEVERARHTERMAYIGTLAAGLAHEIRSPLNSLSLNMQMLDEELAKDRPEGSGRRLLEITSAEIDRLEGLVTEFLSYARPRPMKLEPQKVAEVVTRAVDVVRGGLEASGLEVRVEDNSEGAEVYVDADQIHQMLLNLTQNAAHATERLSRPAWIEYVIERDDEAVRIKVHDNGRGMSEEDLEQATQVFYSRRKGGTGLGLAIVERIVRSHGGGLDFESELGSGTTVTVELPAYSPASGVLRLRGRSRIADQGAGPDGAPAGP